MVTFVKLHVLYAHNVLTLSIGHRVGHPVATTHMFSFRAKKLEEHFDAV